MSDVGEQLVGVWRLVNLERGGRKIPGGLSYLAVRRVFLFEAEGDKKPSPMRGYRREAIDANTLRVEVDHERRGTLHALVQLEGDTMRWRWGAGDGERPRSIDAGGDLERYVRERDPDVAREVNGRGPIERAATLSHADFGTLTHEAFRNVWVGGRFEFDGWTLPVELPGDRRLSPAKLEEYVSKLYDIPLEELTLAARKELEWLSDQLEDDPPEGEGPLQPTMIELLAEGVVIHFAEGFSIETDAAFEIVDVLAQTRKPAGEEPANDPPSP